MNLNPSCGGGLSNAQAVLVGHISTEMHAFEERTMRWPDRVLVGRAEWSTLSTKETSNFYIEGVEVVVMPNFYSMIAPVLDRMP